MQQSVVCRIVRIPTTAGVSLMPAIATACTVTVDDRYPETRKAIARNGHQARPQMTPLGFGKGTRKREALRVALKMGVLLRYTKSNTRLAPP